MARSSKRALPRDLNAFSVELNDESDRACGVLGAAILDARLESLYRRRLHIFADKLLAFNGARATFGGRIKVARALQ